MYECVKHIGTGHGELDEEFLMNRFGVVVYIPVGACVVFNKKEKESKRNNHSRKKMN